MLYTKTKVNKKTWKTSEGLPQGMTARDIVFQVINKVWDGADNNASSKKVNKRQRNWNPEKDPDLLKYLKSVIDSVLSNLVTSAEHIKTNYNNKVNAEDVAKILEEQINKGNDKTLEDVFISEEDNKWISNLLDQLYEELKEDFDKDVLLTFRILAEDNHKVTNILIADELNVDIKEIQKSLKRIRYKLKKLYDTSITKEEEL